MNSPQTIGITVVIDPLVIPGDMDGDLDVDQTDFGLFQACLSGGGVPQTDPACSRAKLDGDGDVDGDDLAIFRSCFTGPGVRGNPNCKQADGGLYRLVSFHLSAFRIICRWPEGAQQMIGTRERSGGHIDSVFFALRRGSSLAGGPSFFPR